MALNIKSDEAHELARALAEATGATMTDAVTEALRSSVAVVLDSSALIAILLNEPESDALVRAIARAATRIVGAPTWIEASAVMLAKKGPGGEVALDALLERMDVRVAPLSLDAARLARLGYVRYGKAVGRPAVLDYGDCLTYGVAMAEAQPRLFKGDDFCRTDVERAL